MTIEERTVDTAIIVQARMGSQRLPGKALLSLAGKRMLEHIVQRLSVATISGPLIVATSEDPTDDFICSLMDSMDNPCFRGDEDDVLDRFWQASKDLDVSYIVRATGDNPLVFEGAVEHLGRIIEETGCDYVTYNQTMPLGMSVEIFRKEVLQRCYEEGREDFHREHVTPYIYTNPEKFDIIRVAAPQGLEGDFRFTVDTQADYDLMKIIYDRLYVPGKIIPAMAAVELMRSEPALVEINADVKQRHFREGGKENKQND